MRTSGYVNMETNLHFFYNITNERGTKTVFTYAHVKRFYGQSERAYYLNYFIKPITLGKNRSINNNDNYIIIGTEIKSKSKIKQIYGSKFTDAKFLIACNDQ